MASFSPWKSKVARRRVLLPWCTFGPLLIAIWIAGMLVFRDHMGTIAMFMPFSVLFLLFAWMLGPVRGFYRSMAEEDFCLSCGDSIDEGARKGRCLGCGDDIAESIRMLEFGRNSAEYKRLFAANFAWRSMISFRAVFPDRADFRMGYGYMLGFYLGLGTLGLAAHQDWVSPFTAALVLNPVMFLAIFSTYHLGPLRRFHRRLAEEDFCMFCEYSLRGHGMEGVCPECGKDLEESLRILHWHRHKKNSWMKLFI